MAPRDDQGVRNLYDHHVGHAAPAFTLRVATIITGEAGLQRTSPDPDTDCHSVMRSDAPLHLMILDVATGRLNQHDLFSGLLERPCGPTIRRKREFRRLYWETTICTGVNTRRAGPTLLFIFTIYL